MNITNACSPAPADPGELPDDGPWRFRQLIMKLMPPAYGRGSERDATRIKLVIGSTALHIWVLLDAVPPKSGSFGGVVDNRTVPFGSKTSAPPASLVVVSRR
jgi:hypothetical protein